jgi:hypothetical protein
MQEKKEREFINKVLREMESEEKVAKRLESYCEELERNRSLRPNERAIQIFKDNDLVISTAIKTLKEKLRLAN